MSKAGSASKVVVDTNIWISFLIGKALRGLQRYIFDGRVKIFTCKEQLIELSEAFRKPKLQKYFSEAQVVEFFDLLDDSTEWVTVSTATTLCRDAKDNYLLSLSIDAQADYLITGDADLLDLRHVNQTRIVKFTDFEKIVG